MTFRRDWQPIATAPRDRGIVARENDGKAFAALFDKGRRLWIKISDDPMSDYANAGDWHPDEWDAASIRRKGE